MNEKEIIKGLMLVLSVTTIDFSSFKLKEYNQYMQAYIAAEKLLKKQNE